MRLQAILAALVLVIAGCALFEPELDGTFSVLIAGRNPIDPLPIDVIDRTGTVTTVMAGQGNVHEGIAGAGRPEVLIVTWMGGRCDVRTTLTLAPNLDAMRITEATEVRAGGCRMAGIMRSIAIRFDQPLTPEFVEFAPALAAG